MAMDVHGNITAAIFVRLFFVAVLVVISVALDCPLDDIFAIHFLLLNY